MNDHPHLAIGLPALLSVLAATACVTVTIGTPVPTAPPTRSEPTASPTVSEPTRPPEGATATPLGTLLGSVTPAQHVVNHGRKDEAVAQLLGSQDLRDGDQLEIQEGGVAQVLLKIGWEFLLFNKTRLGVELKEAESIQDNLLMESGTLLGRRAIEEAAPGVPVVFHLPAGRSITVLGTSFFIVLDQVTLEAMVGNFDGSVEVEGGGVRLALPAGDFIRDWGPGQAPDQATRGQIHFSFEDFLVWGWTSESPSDFGDLVCNNGSRFVEDGTIPDNTEVEPGQSLVKTWRLLNDGSCTWSAGYALVFNRGDRMSGPTTSSIDGPVSPGQTVAVSIQLSAPEKPGEYQGWWQLVSANGEPFGQTPYIKIVVRDRVAPAAPTLLSPKYNEEFSKVDACPDVPLQWSEPEDYSGIQAYELQVWRWDGKNWVAEVQTTTVSNVYTFKPSTCAATQTIYDWRVRATDNAGNTGQFSPTSRFISYQVIG